MKIGHLIFAASAMSLLASCTHVRLAQEGVDQFYTACWHEIGIKPPVIETPLPKAAKTELQERFVYEYRDGFSGQIKKGSIIFSYPNWEWPEDGSKGSAEQFKDKILLFEHGDEDKLRAYLLLIGGRWNLMQMDFPEGIVELKKLNQVPEPTSGLAPGRGSP